MFDNCLPLSPNWIVQVLNLKMGYAIANNKRMDFDQSVTSGIADNIDSCVYYFVTVPRVLFDGWTVGDYKNMFNSEQSMIKCAKTITSFIKVRSI